VHGAPGIASRTRAAIVGRQMPAVSVIMACHRVTPFLRPAVASVLGQTLRDLELVLVDNGAAIEASGALGELGGDPRLRWVRFAANQGIPAAHNAAVAAAAGAFIALLDHDDVMAPTRLEKQAALLRARPDIGMVASLAETIDAAGHVTGREFALLAGDDQRRYLQFAAPVVTPAFTGCREIFLKFPYRAEFSLTADFDFLARASEQTAFATVPEVLLHYRRHATQATQAHAAQIEHQRAAVRACTARRRAGRDEGSLGSGAGPDTAAQACLASAARNLADELPVLAAYHARRAAVVQRTPGVILHSSWLGLRAIAAAGRERPLATRLFFRGPVEALGVKPA
jgi:hypothetical protein